MTTDNPLNDFLALKGKSALSDQLREFFLMWDTTPSYNATLTNEIHANTAFKHEFAKYLVNRALNEEFFTISSCKCLDPRLGSFMSYYVWTAILNNDLLCDQICNLGVKCADLEHGCYLTGKVIRQDTYPLAPVRMQPGRGLYPAWRVFVVNTLCFAAKNFILGIRTDSGPVRYQQYHKGCLPLDKVHTDSKGREWTLFKVDASLSDDYTAVFSNALDGDGTLEICDYINDDDVRVIYRANY